MHEFDYQIKYKNNYVNIILSQYIENDVIKYKINTSYPVLLPNYILNYIEKNITVLTVIIPRILVCKYIMQNKTSYIKNYDTNNYIEIQNKHLHSNMKMNLLFHIKYRPDREKIEH
mgnify:CR=1 FL=1